MLAALGGVGGMLATGNGKALGQGLSTMSPMLALLMRHKHGGDTPPIAQGAPIQAPPGAVPPNPAPAAPGGMDPARRQQLASMLLQFGGGMNRGPFGGPGY